jgi:hypothetical protein
MCPHGRAHNHTIIDCHGNKTSCGAGSLSWTCHLLQANQREHVGRVMAVAVVRRDDAAHVVVFDALALHLGEAGDAELQIGGPVHG